MRGEASCASHRRHWRRSGGIRPHDGMPLVARRAVVDGGAVGVEKGMKASFRIGDDYEVEMYWSPFGLEVYSVNGKEVLRKWACSIRGSRKFTVGDGEERHEVEIKVDFAPTLKSWFFPGEWIAQAYVDGELVVDDLTPRLRRTLRRRRRILRLVYKIFYWILVVELCILAILGILYVVVRYVLPR